MSATVTWIGLAEFKAALLHLPVELTELAQVVVVEAAESAAQEVRDRYHEGETGNLVKGVRVRARRRGGMHTVDRQVASTAPHAWLYEHGSQTRQTALGYGRGRMWGQTPGYEAGANVFIPVMQRYRREMLEDLVAIVEEAGLHVRR